MSHSTEHFATPVAEVDAAAPDDGLVDETAPDEVDSAYGPSVQGSETTSLDPFTKEYRKEYGRTYHSYGSTEHWGPNDEKAQKQQDLSHHVWTLALKNELFLAPVKEPKNILDVGTGTGIWVIEVAERYLNATVTGIDVSPIQPLLVPINAFFQVDDYNLEWLDESKYNLIHGRELLGTSPSWPAIYQQALKALEPGGWYEQHEPSFSFLSDHGQLPANHPFAKWESLMTDAGEKTGLNFDVGNKIKSRMQAAGFVNVTEYRMQWDIGDWSEDEHRKIVGRWNQERISKGIADFCSRRLINHLSFTAQEVEIFCAHMRSALHDKELHPYHWCWFVYGQKPESGKE